MNIGNKYTIVLNGIRAHPNISDIFYWFNFGRGNYFEISRKLNMFQNNKAKLSKNIMCVIKFNIV